MILDQSECFSFHWYLKNQHGISETYRHLYSNKIKRKQFVKKYITKTVFSIIWWRWRPREKKKHEYQKYVFHFYTYIGFVIIIFQINTIVYRQVKRNTSFQKQTKNVFLKLCDQFYSHFLTHHWVLRLMLLCTKQSMSQWANLLYLTYCPLWMHQDIGHF